MQSWRGLDLKELWPWFGAVSACVHPGLCWAAQSWVWIHQSSPDQRGRLRKCGGEHELSLRGAQNPSEAVRTSAGIPQGWEMLGRVHKALPVPPNPAPAARHIMFLITAGENPWVGTRGAGILSHFVPPDEVGAQGGTPGFAQGLLRGVCAGRSWGIPPNSREWCLPGEKLEWEKPLQQGSFVPSAAWLAKQRFQLLPNILICPMFPNPQSFPTTLEPISDLHPALL